MMTRRKTIKRATLAVCGVVACTQNLEAAAPPPEYVLKAKSLVLLIDYVKWPSGVGFKTLGIVGLDPFADALGGLEVRRSKTVDQLKDCQIIFVPSSEGGNVETILETVGSASILTVGETERFAKQGGIIGLVMEDGNVRFEINIATARRAGFRIDLRLLKLALHIITS